jgi:hypothetical protein
MFAQSEQAESASYLSGAHRRKTDGKNSDQHHPRRHWF